MFRYPTVLIAAGVLTVTASAHAQSAGLGSPAPVYARLSPATAEPERDACPDCERSPRRRPGTHFLAELGVGSQLSAPAPVVGGVFGVGGKLRGFPPVFYLIGEFSRSNASRQGPSDGAGSVWAEETSQSDVSGGLRLYLPVIHPIRLFGDLTLGQSRIEVDYDSYETGPLRRTAWVDFVQVGGGLQARLAHHWSVGVRGKVGFYDDFPATTLNTRRQGAFGTLAGTLTAHF